MKQKNMLLLLLMSADLKVLQACRSTAFCLPEIKVFDVFHLYFSGVQDDKS
jgi:hypothetical protein